MPIDRSKMRRGSEAIDKANADRGKGNFKPFLPAIFWKDDGDEHYVLILNPIEDIPQVDFHPFVDLGDKIPHQIIARTDPIIGERKDPIEEDWQYKPRLTNLAIAAVLEPVTKIVNGREKPVGFEVATNTFERRIRNDAGELTEEKEEVTAPVVGLISQSPINFFNQLRQYDATENEIHSTPLKITRLGKKDVTYTVVGYENAALDHSNLLDYAENISYLKDPEALLESLEGLEDSDACVVIGEHLLDLKIDELADDENYQELYEAITEPSRFPAKGNGKAAKKAERPTRQSQRRSQRTAEAGDDVGDAINAPVTVTETPEDEREKSNEGAKEKPDGASRRQERLDALRAKSKGSRKSAE